MKKNIDFVIPNSGSYCANHVCEHFEVSKYIVTDYYWDGVSFYFAASKKQVI